MSTAPREGVLGFRCRNAGKPEGRKLPSFPWTPLIQTVSLEVGPTCLHLQMQITRESEGLVGGPKVTQLGRFSLSRAS